MHVLVNAAVSVDGKLSNRRREQVAISGPDDFARVDRLRAESDAVLVGVGTVLADDPSLAVDDPDLVAARRERGDPPQPARVVPDSRARTPPDARVLDGDGTTYVFVSKTADEDRVAALRDAGAEVVVVGAARVDLPAALDALAERGIEDLMVEGGGEIVYSLFEDGLVDDLSVYVGPMVIGGAASPTLVDGEGFVSDFPALSLETVERIDDGVLLQWRCE